MGTRYHLHVVVGLHADAPADAEGRSLRTLLGVPEDELVSVLNRRLGRGHVFFGDRYSSDSRRDVIVGARALDGTYYRRGGPAVEGPLTPEALREASARAREVLASLGARAEPRMYLLFNVTY